MNRISCRAVSCALVLAMFSAAPALAGPISYVGVYNDSYHSDCDVFIPAPYVPFTAWIWLLPSDTGNICAEYRIEVPASILNIGVVTNPDHSVALGDPINGISICFSECQNDWYWTQQLNLLPTDASVVSYIAVAPHPDAGQLQVAVCDDGYPVEPLTVLNYLHINQSCG